MLPLNAVERIKRCFDVLVKFLHQMNEKESAERSWAYLDSLVSLFDFLMLSSDPFL